MTNDVARKALREMFNDNERKKRQANKPNENGDSGDKDLSGQDIEEQCIIETDGNEEVDEDFGLNEERSREASGDEENGEEADVDDCEVGEDQNDNL
jgi:hypothetical protein